MGEKGVVRGAQGRNASDMVSVHDFSHLRSSFAALCVCAIAKVCVCLCECAVAVLDCTKHDLPEATCTHMLISKRIVVCGRETQKGCVTLMRAHRTSPRSELAENEICEREVLRVHDPMDYIHGTLKDNKQHVEILFMCIY